MSKKLSILLVLIVGVIGIFIGYSTGAAAIHARRYLINRR